MTNVHQLYFLHAISPLHIGVDDSLGAVDLPTMRESHTHYPLVPGSSVKGVLRSEAIADPKKASSHQLAAFGPESDKAGDYRSGLVFTDALLLALPVRSLCGTFAWVSCPQVLRRFNRDLAVIAPGQEVKIPYPATGRGMVATNEEQEASSALLIPKNGNEPDRVFLEEFLLEVDRCSSVRELARHLAAWIWPQDDEAADLFRRRLLVVDDNLFGFLTRLAMEVRSRVPIDRKTGTAAATGPWTEEHMPAETLLYGLVMGHKTTYLEYADRKDGSSAKTTTIRQADDNLAVVQQSAGNRPLLRFGGNGTIGLGRAFFILTPSLQGPN